MKVKKVKCPVCGTYNWSGSEYCEKCSGALYQNKVEEEVIPSVKLIKIFN